MLAIAWADSRVSEVTVSRGGEREGGRVVTHLDAAAPPRRMQPDAGSVLRHRRLFRLRRLRADPLDGVAQFAAKNELGIFRPRIQPVVEHQLAVLVRPHQLQFAQLLDEAAEQGLVEELRRGRRVQQAQALRGLLAQALQFAGAGLPGPFFTSTEMAM